MDVALIRGRPCAIRNGDNGYGDSAALVDESVAGQPSYVLDRVQQAIPELPYTQVEPVQIHLTIRTRTFSDFDKRVRAGGESVYT